ncbi:MAG: cytochrome c [Pirellulales bacterium]|nr:cytochrome c [Pirellulales bacterium]
MSACRRLVRLPCLATTFVGVLSAASRAEDGRSEPTKRAARPAWTADVVDVFFADARAELVGPRPVGADATARAASAGAAEGAASAGGFAWSQLVDGAALADEIKRTANRLAGPLASPGKFKSGGNKQCRGDFAMLAVLAAVVAEHDDDVRWKRESAALAVRFAAVADACRKATDEAYAVAQTGKEQLDDLLRGQGPAEEAGAAARPAWSELASLPTVMQRMETALHGVLLPALADERTMRRQSVDVQREAQLLAMLAEIVQREDYDYREEEEYRASAAALLEAARAIAHAARDNQYDAARAAAGRAGQACSACHEGFRG